MIEKAMTRSQVEAGRRNNGGKKNQYPNLVYTQNTLVRFRVRLRELVGAKIS